jgi:hypothetical protein
VSTKSSWRVGKIGESKVFILLLPDNSKLIYRMEDLDVKLQNYVGINYKALRKLHEEITNSYKNSGVNTEVPQIAQFITLLKH